MKKEFKADEIKHLGTVMLDEKTAAKIDRMIEQAEKDIAELQAKARQKVAHDQENL